VAGDDPGDNLLGKAVLGMLRGYLVPIDSPDKQTLREIFENPPDDGCLS